MKIEHITADKGENMRGHMEHNGIFSSHGFRVTRENILDALRMPRKQQIAYQQVLCSLSNYDRVPNQDVSSHKFTD